MLSPITKLFTHNCPNVEALLTFENLSDGFLLKATDQNKAPVLVPVPTLQRLNNSDPTALVVDHTSDAVSNNKGKHPLLSIDDFVQPDAMLENKKIEAPKPFRGVAPLLNPINSLVWKILSVSPSTYSTNSNTKSITALVVMGSAISLVPNVHTRSFVRVFILGSLSLFSGFVLRAGIQKSGNEVLTLKDRLPLPGLALYWAQTPGLPATCQIVDKRGNKELSSMCLANFTTIVRQTPSRGQSKAFGQPELGSGDLGSSMRSGVNYNNLKPPWDVDVVKEAKRSNHERRRVIHARRQQKLRRTKGLSLQKRVTLRPHFLV
ncbi:hypothetical protein Nepgr_026795 [Nepenthes gracilis]|uniref:Dolichyl-diphosphooligosaccharide--protein glycosyltransferase 48 kDa subunit n=1 Tax=Nepenthes gracilis TaxID=150966 RepID=A0AAD3T8U2_NEPGR|nr:hypothetical protein Nepgr_026795 [Nepenthes gracilis]